VAYYPRNKRILDVCVSLTLLVIVSPLLLLIVLVLLFTSGYIFYRQLRVGRNGREFFILKFRTMNRGSDSEGLLTVGEKDKRITRTGLLLRKYKLDELPQLFNILKGDMSVVGPRPEVRKYVELYDERQKKVLSFKPGLTDYASLVYMDENRMLAESTNPEKTYIEEIMPAKLELNHRYLSEMSPVTDLKIIGRTLAGILRARKDTSSTGTAS
jgi:lipopolysaccharide/colanic/teichoic acid biosynthesis glycosyltransferase